MSGPFFTADAQSPELVQPCEAPLDYPSVESDSTKHREAEEWLWNEHPSTGENSVPSPAIGSERGFVRLF